MSDGILGGVAENLKDFVEETGKQAGTAIKDIPKVVVEQATGKEIADKQTATSLLHVRSELASIPSSSQEKTGPEIISKKAFREGFSTGEKKKTIFKDLASQQAATKAETGHGNKG